jgi:zinc protease
MMRMTRSLSRLAPGALVALLALGGSRIGAAVEARRATTTAPADSLRLDPLVRVGVLPNGIRYFIRPNSRPAARVSLRLAVRAGSTAEADDQQGLAHFVEHMNFNGSRHFAPDSLWSYLRSIGLRVGADANAYTRFDETVYMLDVPTDRESLLARGLDVLSDFAGGATMTDREIEKERGVVLEEWRLGQGAWDRMFRKQFPVLYHGSRYAERLPIGKPEIIEKAPPGRIRDFYRDWYTPDRMAVVAVGDVDPARMERLIRDHFGSIAPDRAPRPTPRFDVPPHQETLISVATDREATGTRVSILYKRPLEPENTVADFRRALVQELFENIVNARLSEVAHGANAPFLGAGCYDGLLGKTVEYLGLSASVSPGGVEKGLAAVLDEMTRVQRHGLLLAELARAKSDLLTSYDKSYAERDKSESPSFASSYISYFLDHEPDPGIETEYRLAKQLVPEIGLDEVASLSKRLVHDDNRVVLVTASDRPETAPPSEDRIRTILDGQAARGVEPWKDQLTGKSLMARPPKPGTIRSRRRIEELGVTVLTLSNGVEVWLKPTDFKADEIVFEAYAPGGASLADSAEYANASLSAAIVSECGVGGFTGVDLEKLTSGKLASAHPYLDDYGQGVTGSCRPEDLETALQLTHLTFTTPTRDTIGFAAFRKRLESWLAERANSPDAVFEDTLTAVNTNRFYMDRPLTTRELQSLSLDRALAFYRRRYANAADFAFFFTGSFKVEAMEPLIARYLGSLPSTGARTSTFVARVPTFPGGTPRVRVVKGLEPKSTTRITFFANPGREELELHRLRAACSILTDRLRQILREELGGTYGASAGYAGREPATGYGTVSVSFGSSPENVDRMVAATLKEIERLRNEGPSAEDVSKEKEVERRELEVSMKRNGYWNGSLRMTQLMGWDARRIAKRFERIDLLTPDLLRETFRRYLPADRFTVASLFPEKQSSSVEGARQ